MANWRPARRLLLLLLGTALLLLVALAGLAGLGPPFDGSWFWTPVAQEEGTAETSGTAEAAEPSADSREHAAGGSDTATETTVLITVHLTGAVRMPGVYRLPAGATLIDAVTAAGGLTATAAREHVNLAALVPDHALVRIPSREEVDEREPPLYAVSPLPAGSEPRSATGADPAATAQAAPVNLNTADQGMLETLPGVGPQIAQAILRQREELGGFASVEDLLLVPGIGERRLEALRPLVTVAP
ncbi:MAG: helix-hairpin-helix domain-containing protein [Bacillota bacterium]|nr:helix-hairpin-helix domain-containing protein [Bacillota bacterium]